MTALAIMPRPAAFEDGYLAPSVTASAGARSSIFEPEGSSLWHVVAELDAGTELSWSDDHGDEAVYVVEGSLEVDGQPCGPAGTVIVEAGVATAARATSATRVLHFGPVESAPPTDGLLGPPDLHHHGVHVINDDAVKTLHFGGTDFDTTMRSYADSTCPTCRITFFRVDEGGARVTNSHTHSVDEIIHVLSGELHLGRHVVTAGQSLAVPGNLRYGFRTPGDFSFLNYRRDVSEMVRSPGTAPVLETVECSITQWEQLGPQLGLELTLVNGFAG